ncbi:MAG: sigma 54-interacting transcriptional regulator [Nitrospirae bacterium]|nr:sigma 54-interacting transcriptional regulator [Nitrospirota bacterium]MBI3351141.1 sigma 54-interacting transcriptional regulator [Nitrospirota bacterium]
MQEIPYTFNPEWLLNSFPEGIIALNSDQKILFVNPSAESLLGISKKDFVGKRCSHLIEVEGAEQKCLLERTLQTEEPLTQIESKCQNKQGEKLVLRSSTFMLKDEHDKSVGAVIQFRVISSERPAGETAPKNLLFDKVVGKNPRMLEIYNLIPGLARTKSTVLIEGESGTGKESIAHALHSNSPRREKPYVRVNCGALAEGILESELFGHVKGAYTGAISNKQGRFELAHEGTIFLDEIGDVSLSTQVKLLRVLQEEEFERVGDTKPIKVDVRVIAATNKDLKKAMDNGQFRQDLYYRLRVVPITLPPLRERRDDIPLLINHFMKVFNQEMEKNVEQVSPQTMSTLINYEYPGNIRELENIIEHALVLCNGNIILPEHLPRDIQIRKSDHVDRAISREHPLEAMERELIIQVLNQCNWNFKETSEKLRISRTTLWRKMKDYHIVK